MHILAGSPALFIDHPQSVGLHRSVLKSLLIFLACNNVCAFAFFFSKSLKGVAVNLSYHVYPTLLYGPSPQHYATGIPSHGLSRDLSPIAKGHICIFGKSLSFILSDQIRFQCATLSCVRELPGKYA